MGGGGGGRMTDIKKSFTHSDPDCRKQQKHAVPGPKRMLNRARESKPHGKHAQLRGERLLARVTRIAGGGGGARGAVGHGALLIWAGPPCRRRGVPFSLNKDGRFGARGASALCPRQTSNFPGIFKPERAPPRPAPGLPLRRRIDAFGSNPALCATAVTPKGR